MTTINADYKFPQAFQRTIVLPLIVAGLLIGASSGLAQLPPGWGPPTNTPTASWSFQDQVNWTSDQGYPPISFTNLNFSWLGDGASLVVDTNVPAWLNFNVIEPETGVTNLVLDAPGSLSFWYAPADWSSTNTGGTGPGEWTQLIDVGEWTPDASYGYWGLSVDPAGSNLWFVVQDDAGDAYGLSAPISWTTNYFHFICLSYSSTNVSIYLDGELATNDPGGLSISPGPDAISGGVFFGSDTNGLMQADGFFDTIQTFSYPLASNDVQKIFNWNYWHYYIVDPYNVAMWNVASVVSAPSTPAYTPTFNAVAGQGFLTPVYTNTTSCITSSNVWMTNVLAAVVGTNVNFKFTIAGGSNGVPYDVFANSVLALGTNYGTNLIWAWMGQGYQCVTYTLTNLPLGACFLVLGTPQDSYGNGLTDAYELLVLHKNPAIGSGDGMLDGWKVLWGMNPLVNNSAQPSERANYLYDGASRLESATGIVNEAFGFDAQGNIQLDQP